MNEFPEKLYTDNQYNASIYTTPEEGTTPIYRVRKKVYGDLVLYAYQTDVDGGPYLWIRYDESPCFKPGFVSCVLPQSLREALKDIDALNGD